MQKHCHTCVLLHMTFTSLMWQFLCVLTILYSCFLSVAVLRHPDQRQFRGRKVYLAYRTRSQSIIEGSQARNLRHNSLLFPTALLLTQRLSQSWWRSTGTVEDTACHLACSLAHAPLVFPESRPTCLGRVMAQWAGPPTWNINQDSHL